MLFFVPASVKVKERSCWRGRGARPVAHLHTASAEYSFGEVPVEPPSGRAAARPERMARSSQMPGCQLRRHIWATSPTITLDGKRLVFLKIIPERTYAQAGSLGTAPA